MNDADIGIKPTGQPEMLELARIVTERKAKLDALTKVYKEKIKELAIKHIKNDLFNNRTNQ